MNFIERGQGTPIVFIPGLQGRWEYTRVTVEALAKHFRVVTFSLGDEPAAGFSFDAARGFDSYADQVLGVLDSTATTNTVVCGVSFGGLVALRFAARHPERVSALVLASTPGPGWHLRPRHDVYARWPLIFGPLFAVEVPFRARAELVAALPDASERRAFSASILKTVASAPISFRRMAQRARMIATYDTTCDAARISAPTLVLTGEATLDHVVDVEGSSRYEQLIPGATHVVLSRTGHQGTLTRPDLFADEVSKFLNGSGRSRGSDGPDGARGFSRALDSAESGRVA
ncbi:MAG TPA: alpha/beta hydrolase [Vicinamibacterales bacterium]|jgi:pimeloyl-ACP methyl ester carboxylesterase